MGKKMMVNWRTLAASLAISLGVGALSSLVTSDGISGYSNMYKPPLSPPAWIFPIVWTILFVLMGVAAYLVYESIDNKKDEALMWYGGQLAANFLWTIIFFNFEAYWLAFIWIIVLLALIVITTLKFYEINRIAAWLMVPYIVWVAFATYLTFAIAIN